VIPTSRQRNYLQSGLYVIVVGIIATLLLERLLTYAEAAEKSAMEATLGRLHAALYTRIAYLTLRGEYEAIEQLPRQSPFTAATVSSVNYVGEFVGLPLDVKGGSWLYDRVRNELVYVPNLRRHLRVAEDGERAMPHLRYRLELLKSSDTTYVGVSLRPTGGARWEPLP
jgi:hypothetical protein